jgi:CheY-like chemotaxis protein
MEDKKRILVIDDMPQVRDFLCNLLDADGFEVHGCEDGIAALAAAEKTNFDVIITDYRMPKMDGLEATKHLRIRLPASIIVGISIENVKNDFIKAGADAFLFKPFEYNYLLELLTVKLAERSTSGVV